MRFSILAVLGVLLHFGYVSAQAQEPDPANDALFEQLKDEDMNVRIAALRELQTTLDPRLPEALLILLNDEGNTTRWLAARGIGSRYWQIPEKRVPVYLKGRSENSGGMIGRAIALLTREYKSPEMSRSANDRWVLYERYSRPCLIDTKNGTEELFGWEPEKYVDFYNRHAEEVGAFSPWHPEKEMVAMVMGLSRRTTTTWIWIHQRGLIKLDHDKMVTALGYKPEHTIYGAGFFVEPLKWEGKNLRLECDFHTVINPEEIKQGVAAEYGDVKEQVNWNPITNTVAKSS